MPNSRFALHGLALPYFTVRALLLPLIHGFNFMRLFRPLLNLSQLTAPSWPASQFTVCTSRLTRLRFESISPLFS